MFVYPDKARVDRKLPKSVIYKNAHPSAAVKDLFVKQVEEIKWRYKLAPDTINIPPRAGYSEIQVFDIALKTEKFAWKVLETIDKAIPYPIFYRLHNNGRSNSVAAYKRPGLSDTGRWVSGTYFETGWTEAPRPENKLPVALDMQSLYEEMLVSYIGIVRRHEETIAEVVDRHLSIQKTAREIDTTKMKMGKEKQFNRKVELNASVRELQFQYDSLTK